MSGPVDDRDLAFVTVTESGLTEVGGVPVRRALPRRGRRSWEEDDGRFGRVASPLGRIPAPGLVRLAH